MNAEKSVTLNDLFDDWADISDAIGIERIKTTYKTGVISVSTDLFNKIKKWYSDYLSVADQGLYVYLDRGTIHKGERINPCLSESRIDFKILEQLVWLMNIQVLVNKGKQIDDIVIPIHIIGFLRKQKLIK